LVRDGAPLALTVTLGTMPPDKTADADAGERTSDASELARLGLTLRVNRGDDGVVVAAVDPESPAADEGLRRGDGSLEVGGTVVGLPSQVAEEIDAAKSDGKRSVLFRVKSDEGERFLALPTEAS
jgi:serine protease Do